jgi:glycosyltransferase involved in cell wall biosynthesis
MSDHRHVVSVVVPVFNGARTIGRAVHTILNQTYRELDVIVVDDASTDDTPEIVGSLCRDDTRLRYVKNTGAKGPAGARNTGIKLARGEFLAFLDADDVWHPDHVMRAASILSERSDVVSVLLNFDIVSEESGEQLDDWFSDRDAPRQLPARIVSDELRIVDVGLVDSLLTESYAHLPALVVRREQAAATLMNEEIMHAEDRDFSIRLLLQSGKSMAFVDVVTGIYFRHSESLSAPGVEHTYASGRARSLLYNGYLRDNRFDSQQRSIIRRELSKINLRHSWACRELNSYREAARSVLESMRGGIRPNHLKEISKIISGLLLRRP